MGLIRLPRLGETMEEARVVLWLKVAGETFARGEVLLEVETDKTVVEIPALEDGLLARQLVAPGETAALGQAIAETGRAGDPEPLSNAPEGARSPPHRTPRHPFRAWPNLCSRKRLRGRRTPCCSRKESPAASSPVPEPGASHVITERTSPPSAVPAGGAA